MTPAQKARTSTLLKRYGWLVPILVPVVAWGAVKVDTRYVNQTAYDLAVRDNEFRHTIDTIRANAITRRIEEHAIRTDSNVLRICRVVKGGC